MGLFVLLLTLFSIPGVFPVNDFYPQNRVTVLADVPANATDYILPTNLMPTTYDLTVQPFLDNATFSGHVVITFDVLNATDTVVLNVHNSSISIESAVLTAAEGTLSTTWTVDNVHDMVSFSPNSSLAVQTGAVINIVYSGVLREDMLGFYISTYDSADGLMKMAITQFEANNARRAFPCLDEPAYRAKFDVKVVRLQNQTSMGNMPLLSSTPVQDTEWVLDVYNTTPAMPTYLVAFGVSQLSQVNSSSFRIYARPAALPESAYLLSVGQTILDSIAAFLDIPYPLPKMDVVAVPDFNAGAMENWGLTTYREKYVLWNSSLNTWRDKYGVLSVVAHEFGHQWFGDLVTPQWWSYAWLNEAFATYFEYVVPNIVSADWDVGSTEFVVSAVQPALASDVGSPRPMTRPLYTSDQIEASFDYVIYEKGGSILRMIENVLTTDVWKAGLKQYLIANSYKTGTPEELFSALEAAAGAAVPGLNETLYQWTSQAGFPLITVSTVASNLTNTTQTQYLITQTPYNLDNSSASVSWNVPLVYTTQFDKQFDASLASRHWLLPSVDNSSSLAVNHSGWVIFNIDQIGFYRVNYDEDNWLLLKAQLDEDVTVVSEVNRAALVDDALHLARTGHLNYSTALGLTQFLANDTAPAPWSALITNAKFLINQFFATSTGDGLQIWARNLLSPLAAKFNTSTYKDSLTTLLASQFACDINLDSCVSMATEAFSNWLKDTSVPLQPETKQAVICTGLRLDTAGENFAAVWKYFLDSNNAIEQLLLLNTFGCATNDNAITTYLDAVCDAATNQVRLQDRWIAFRALLSRQSGVLPGLRYLVNNYDKVSSALGADFSGVFSYLASTISQASHIAEVQSIISNTTVSEKLRASLNSTVVPAVAKRQAWAVSEVGASLEAWVAANVNSAATAALVNLCLSLTLAAALLIHSL